jgi:hypothetical protein
VWKPKRPTLVGMVPAAPATRRFTGYARLLVLLLLALWLGGAVNGGVAMGAVDRVVLSLSGRTRRHAYAGAAVAG